MAPHQPQEPPALANRQLHLEECQFELPIVIGPASVYAYAIYAGLRALEDIGIGAGLHESQVLGPKVIGHGR